MTTEEALRLGFIVAGPILSVAGLFFAIAISASPYHNLVGKALAWPLSPMAGLAFAVLAIVLFSFPKSEV